jgi:hypothetical protein
VPREYQIPDVNAELIVDVAKTLANSSSPMTIGELANCYLNEYSDEYIRRAAIANTQMGLAELSDKSYRCAESHRDILKKSNKSELKVVFRSVLQNYGPFLLFADYLSKGFASADAGRRTRGLFRIRTSPDTIERGLKSWGKYAELIEETASGLKLRVQTQNLLFDYVRKLVEALEAELKAKLFSIDMVGPEIFAYLDNNEIKLDDLAIALRNYETDPKHSAGRALEIFERFVYTIATQRGVDPQKSKGLMEWIDGLRATKNPEGERDLASNLLLLCHGMVAMRNMTHHDPDSETGRVWNISKQAALTSTLMVPIVLRTIHLYVMQRKQEF